MLCSYFIVSYKTLITEKKVFDILLGIVIDKTREKNKELNIK